VNVAEVSFSVDELETRTSNFTIEVKEEYMRDFKDCVVRELEHGFVVDTESKEWSKFYYKYQNRPPPSLSQAATLAHALIRGRQVSLLVQQERIETCFRCNFRRLDENGVPWCGQCGCGIASERSRIGNLASYYENLPSWGCKHPLRSQGLGWKI